MKRIRIYERYVTERTIYKKYRYKEVKQYIIYYDNERFDNNDFELDSKRIRVPFKEVLNTRKKSELIDYINTLGRSDVDTEMKILLNKIYLWG